MSAAAHNMIAAAENILFTAPDDAVKETSDIRLLREVSACMFVVFF
jgi:hypothetical protein